MSSVEIVTGASQGIGRATAIRLTRDFKYLVLVARNLETLEETANLVKAKGRTALVVDIDLSKPTSAEVIVSSTICCILSMYPRNPWIGRLIHNLPKK
jgi:3-oxoacyl-[acyl-carrier protein] reductase